MSEIKADNQNSFPSLEAAQTAVANIVDGEKFDINQITISDDFTTGLVVVSEKENKLNLAILVDLETNNDIIIAVNDRAVHVENELTLAALLSPSGRTVVLLSGFTNEDNILDIRYLVFCKNDDWTMTRDAIIRGTDLLISDRVPVKDQNVMDLILLSKNGDNIDLKMSTLKPDKE